MLEQDFTYTTNWDSSPNGGTWASKSTSVNTTVRAVVSGKLTTIGSYTTSYTYSSLPPPYQPYDSGVVDAATQIPVERSITYNDFSGTGLRTVYKSWGDAFQMDCESTTQGGLTSRIDYQYSTYGLQVTDKKEWDWGQQSVCPTPYTAPTGTPLRETITAYQSLGDTLSYTYGPSIFDRPSSVTIKGSGTQMAQTSYGYDTPPPSPAGITVGRDSHYNGNTTVARGNATSMSKSVNASGGSLTWNVSAT